MISERVAEKKGPLIVLLGEFHHVSSHVVMVQALMEGLQRSAPNLSFAYGLERQYDLLEKIMTEKLGTVAPPHQRGAITAADKDGKQLIDAYLQTEVVPGAPMSRHNVLAFCRAHNVSVRAVDTTLGDEDPLARLMIERHAPHLVGTEIRGISIEGMHLRNRAVVARTQSHLQDTGADVYFLPYGSAHLLGWNKGIEVEHDYPTSQSLGALFDQQGIQTLTVFQTWSGGDTKIDLERCLPKDISTAQLRKSVIVNDLTPAAFWQNPDKGQDFSSANKNIGAAEVAHLQEMSYQSNGKLKLYPPLLLAAPNVPNAPTTVKEEAPLSPTRPSSKAANALQLAR
jgi:hypothetical protein